MIFFYSEGSETLQQVAKRWGRCRILGNLQGQAGQVSEQADLAAHVPAHGWGFVWMMCVWVLFLLLWVKWFKMLLSIKVIPSVTAKRELTA